MGLSKVVLSLVIIVLMLNVPEIYGQMKLNVTESRRESDNTERIDPLDGLKIYRGGYDITNKHYLSSTAFTGIPGYTIGVLWLLCGFLYGLHLLCTPTNSPKLNKNHQKYHWHILLVTIFAVLAIIATGVVLGANAKFHSRAKKVMDIIIDTAYEASEIMQNTTGAMEVVSNNLKEANAAVSQFLSSTSVLLASGAADLQKQAENNRFAIHNALRIMYIITSVVISANLVAVITLSILGVLKFKRPFYVLITFCWVVTIIFWIFWGVYFSIGNFAGDTCTALEDFQKDPYNNSLSTILPCDQLLSAKSALSDFSTVVYNLVNEINSHVNSDFQFCNPFSSPPEYNYINPDSCSETALRVGDIPELVKMMTCIDPENGVCNGAIPISSRVFKTVQAYTSSVETLLNSYPGMESLVTCQRVKNTFAEITEKHCKPLKTYVRIVWASMAFLSTTMAVLLVTWAIRAYHDLKCHSSDGSVRPHTTSTTDIEKNYPPERNIDDYTPTSLFR